MLILEYEGLSFVFDELSCDEVVLFDNSFSSHVICLFGFDFDRVPFLALVVRVIEELLKLLVSEFLPFEQHSHRVLVVYRPFHGLYQIILRMSSFYLHSKLIRTLKEMTLSTLFISFIA